jgi:hypothetical protein
MQVLHYIAISTKHSCNHNVSDPFENCSVHGLFGNWLYWRLFFNFLTLYRQRQLGSHTSQALTSSVIILNSVNSHSSEVNVCVLGWPNLWKNVCVSHVHRNTHCVTCTGCCYGVVSCKASHVLRPFYDLLFIHICVLIIPDSSTRASRICEQEKKGMYTSKN